MYVNPLHYIHIDVSPGGHTPPPTREWMPLADGYVQDGTTAALSDSEEEEEEGEGEKESSVSASSSVMKETDDHVEQDTDSSGSPETRCVGGCGCGCSAGPEFPEAAHRAPVFG